jgi:hypothetical protein
MFSKDISGINAIFSNMLPHFTHPEPEFVNLSRSPGIDSQPGGIVSLESIDSWAPRKVYKVGLGTVDQRVCTLLQEVEIIAKAMRQRKNSK